MPKPRSIQLGNAAELAILYEDRSVLAVDKTSGWMLVPTHWDRTARNLQLAIDSSIRGGEFWAKSRNLRFLRFVHRLDAETTGVLLFAKSPGGVPVYSKLFESRQMEKRYLAVVAGNPPQESWTVNAPISPDVGDAGRMRIDQRNGKEAETHFVIVARGEKTALVEAQPLTGRTHQIRLHLAHSGFTVLGDRLYGNLEKAPPEFPLALRAVSLAYTDPFTKKPVRIVADAARFKRTFGFKETSRPSGESSPPGP